MNQWQLYKLIIKVFSVTILNSSFTFYGISMTTMLILIVVMGIVHTHEKNIKQQWNSKIVCDYDIFIKIFFIRFFIRIYSIKITTIQPRSRDLSFSRYFLWNTVEYHPGLLTQCCVFQIQWNPHWSPSVNRQIAPSRVKIDKAKKSALIFDK